MGKAKREAVPYELVVFDYVPPSDLSLNGRKRLSPLEIHRLQEAVKERVALVLNAHEAAGGQLPHFDRAAVRIRFVYPQRRRRDPDNLAGLAKPILDLLRERGVLTDDDCEHITLTISALTEAGRTETDVWIEDLP